MEGGFAPIVPEQIHPMARMRAEMQRTWLARPGQKLQRNEEESSEKIERMESKAAALRKSLLSAWVVTQEQSVEVTEKMGEVSVSEPAGFSSSTVNTGRPSTLAIGCGRPLLAAWTSGQCPIKEEDKEPRIKETKRCLLAHRCDVCAVEPQGAREFRSLAGGVGLRIR